jgi:hypothetical protein
MYVDDDEPMAARKQSAGPAGRPGLVGQRENFRVWPRPLALRCK